MSNDGVVQIPGDAPAAGYDPATLSVLSQLVAMGQTGVVAQHNFLTEQKMLDGKFLLRRHSLASALTG